VTRFTSVGTHRSPLMGLAPTQKPARWSGISIDRVVGGKLAEEWVSCDLMGMLQQLGAVSWPS
jgi:predicted ester cyclase